MDRLLHRPCTLERPAQFLASGGKKTLTVSENCAGEFEHYHHGALLKSQNMSLGKRHKQMICEKQFGVAVISPNVSLSALLVIVNLLLPGL